MKFLLPVAFAMLATASPATRDRSRKGLGAELGTVAKAKVVLPLLVSDILILCD